MIPSTKLSVLDRQCSMYLSYRKKLNHWAIGYGHREHNDPMNPDPFSYFVHRTRRMGHDKALELAKGRRGEAPYNKILKNHDLKIEQKQFYNLTRAKATPNLKPDDELTRLLATLDREDFQVHVNNGYQTSEAGMIKILKAAL